MRWAIVILAVVVLASCAKQPLAQAVVDLKATNISSVAGLVTFTQYSDRVRIQAKVFGLSPGEHGFHIHEQGDCTAPDASSAGGHFNPFQDQHGSPGSAQRHAGDLGNVVADDQGRALRDIEDAHITLQGDHSILGRSVIVHKDTDDFSTQPTGNAGARLACGVIRLQ